VRLNTVLLRTSTAALLACGSFAPVAAQTGAEITSFKKTSDAAIIDVSRVRIDNFGQVNAKYYRGEQPEGRDYADLAALGIRTVIDLQGDGDNQDESRLVEAAGMKFYRIPMTTHVPPTPEQLAFFKQIVNDPVHQPVYVHCKGGKHRTGVMTAVYRMEQDGWTAAQAFDEMKQYKFGWDFLHPEFKKFVYGYRVALAAKAPGQIVATTAAQAEKPALVLE
jgi:protein tyrosine/serine phosphatase